MEKSILVSVVGRTDPMRSEHDGPIMHIIRHYRPERAVLFLTEEIEALERPSICWMKDARWRR